MDIFSLRMRRAALKQYLTDRSKELRQDEIDRILDTIFALTKLIEELEKKRN